MTDRHSAETAVSPASPTKAELVDEKNTTDLTGSKELQKGGDGNIQISTLDKNAIYDPRQESIWTRFGLNFESFKRAPGTTGGHHGAWQCALVYESVDDSAVLEQLSEGQTSKHPWKVGLLWLLLCDTY